jgi:hypothetical protein
MPRTCSSVRLCTGLAAFTKNTSASDPTAARLKVLYSGIRSRVPAAASYTMSKSTSRAASRLWALSVPVNWAKRDASCLGMPINTAATASPSGMFAVLPSMRGNSSAVSVNKFKGSGVGAASLFPPDEHPTANRQTKTSMNIFFILFPPLSIESIIPNPQTTDTAHRSKTNSSRPFSNG